MQPGDETYILYGILFVSLLLGLLFNVAKYLGFAKIFLSPKE